MLTNYYSEMNLTKSSKIMSYIGETFSMKTKIEELQKKKKKEKSSLLHSNEVSISVIPKSDKDGIRKENTGYSHF